MIIELFYDEIGTVTGFRHSWAKSPKNPPLEENIRIIDNHDFDELVRFMSHVGIEECDEDQAHYKSGNLYMKALDYRSDQALKSPEYRDALQVSKH